MARYRDPLTKDLFSWQPPKVGVGYSEDVIGRGRLDNKIARLIAQALRLPLAEAERLALVTPQPWGRLAWRIEANCRRWERLQARRDGR